MEELKDIILNKGDVIYFEPQGQYPTYAIFGTDKECKAEYFCEKLAIDDWYPKITKIERPIKYETIYEAPKEILDKEEKKWLENFLRPFRDRISFIAKYSCIEGYEYICIHIKDDTNTTLPDFELGTMYKGMELNKEYTLKELGLFEGE